MKNVLALLFLVSTTVFSQETIPLQPCEEKIKSEYLRSSDSNKYVLLKTGIKCMPKLDQSKDQQIDRNDLTIQEYNQLAQMSYQKQHCQQQQQYHHNRRYDTNQISSLDHVRKIHFGDIVKFNGKLYKCEDWSK